MLRRIEVQADDVVQLLGEPLVVGQLERPDPVRLQPVLPPAPGPPSTALTPTALAIEGVDQ